jgi:hypothetical protein
VITAMRSPSSVQRVSYEFIAYVDERGGVHVDPLNAGARDRALLQRLRTRLDPLHFPAKLPIDLIWRSRCSPELASLCHPRMRARCSHLEPLHRSLQCAGHAPRASACS